MSFLLDGDKLMRLVGKRGILFIWKGFFFCICVG